MTKQVPERDYIQLKQSKITPGNRSYSNMTSKGRKILILSDSILGRIQMNKFNNDLPTGRAYRKYFPGATPKEIAYYCLPILRNDKPDVVVLHIGTNSTFNDDSQSIANDIFNMVKTCHDHGVNEVFVSGIIFRNRHISKIRELNNLLELKKETYNFKFINNDNIFAKDLGKDNLHLNYTGNIKIANNIIDAINNLHA